MTAAVTAGVPAGCTAVTPYIAVVDSERVIEFAREAFGAVEEYRTTGSAGGPWCLLRIGDSMLMVSGGAALTGREKLNALHIYVPDTDATYRRALEAGAESLYEPVDKPYGERNAGVKDPAGNLWFPATRHPGVPRLEGMRTVTPFVLARNALGLIEFVKRAFSAREEAVLKTPEGKLMHGALWIGDALLAFGEAEGLPFAFYVYVPDVDAVYQQGVAAGAKPLSPPAEQRWGDRTGGVEDPWGNTWYIGTPRRESQ